MMKAILLCGLLIMPLSTNALCKRSTTVKQHFMKATGFPHGRSGYVVDHIIPLACGGADSVDNMQWQTVYDGKMKDKIERKYCGGCKHDVER